MSENTNRKVTITNSAAHLLGLLLNQDGWVKGVEQIIIAGDLIQVLPEERPTENADTWDKKPFELELTSKQLKAAKQCFTTLADKGSLLANENVLILATALDFEIPDTEATVEIKLPQISAKYLVDCFTMGKTKTVADLIAATQVLTKLPKLDPTLAEKGKEAELKAWMHTEVTFKITERQRDACRSVLKAVAEDGSVRANRFIPILYTEFGLRE